MKAERRRRDDELDPLPTLNFDRRFAIRRAISLRIRDANVRLREDRIRISPFLRREPCASFQRRPTFFCEEKMRRDDATSSEITWPNRVFSDGEQNFLLL